MKKRIFFENANGQIFQAKPRWIPRPLGSLEFTFRIKTDNVTVKNISFGDKFFNKFLQIIACKSVKYCFGILAI